MGKTTAEERELWKEFECNPGAMTIIDFGPARIRVAPPTVDAFHALASVLLFHGYRIRVGDTDSYNCRAIKGGTGRSLHSYGIAVDVDWDTNPFKETPDQRAVKFSDKATQDDRAHDVKLGLADTDMTPDLIADVLAIKTNNKQTVFEWGGNWKDRKDSMHFELDVTPTDLQTGIDWGTVKQSRAAKAGENGGGTVVLPANQLAMGSRGDEVKKLQTMLVQRGYGVGDIDGIYGNQTAAAVRAFQASQKLTQTGIADDATLKALALPQMGDKTMQPEDVLRGLFGALFGNQPAASTPPAGSSPGNPTAQQLVELILNTLIANRIGTGAAAPGGAPQASTTTTTSPGTSTSPPVLSPIDQWLGGSALAGKKTALSVIAYAVLSILQAAGAAGTATGPTSTTTGQILTTLIAAFGGLGLTAKIDRVVQALGLIAAKPAAPSK